VSAQVLIRSHVLDYHAHAVRWALERRGVGAEVWDSSAFPAEQSLGLAVERDGGVSPWIGGENPVHDLSGISVVWNRRRGSPTLSAQLHEADHPFVRKEVNIFLAEFARELLPEALWVNPVEAQHRDVHKVYQLRTAGSLGFPVPPTIVTNDPDAIADFYRAHDGDVVFKAFTGGFWSSGGGRQAQAVTAAVDEDHLAYRNSLAAAPGIYQKRIPKRDELRVTVMGRTCFAARLDSQSLPEAAIDWRVAGFAIPIEWIDMPDDLARFCLRYMDRAGLRYASFDFVRTPAGETVFLEVNQTGQFLWKELNCPAMPLLAAFSAFLASADPGFAWQREEADGISLAAFQASGAFERMKELQQVALSRQDRSGIYQE